MTARLALVLLSLAQAAWADAPQAVVTPAPGRFTAAVTVNVAVPDGATVSYRFLESSDSNALPWTAPLVLDALPGETRVYTLRLTTQSSSGGSVVHDFAYTVAPPAVPYPTVQPVPGTYTTRVGLRPQLPDGWVLTEAGAPVPTPPVLDAPNGTLRTYVFEVRGPGRSVVWTYTIDRRDQNPSLDVVSPVAGTWANIQPLALVFHGLDRVVWSYGDRIDDAATEYTGPVNLNPGAQTITIAGRTRDGQWLERRVSWTSGQADPPPGWPTSGVRTAAADFPETAGWTFSWDDGKTWQTGARREDAPLASRKIVVAEAKTGDAVSRYVYWFDVRAPQRPELRFEGGWNPRVLFSGAPESPYHVRWQTSDGKSLDGGSIWGPTGSWKVPDGVVGASVSVQAAVGEAEAKIGFDETGWAVPVLQGERVLPKAGFAAVYEVSSTPEVREPGAASPVLDGAFLPVLPLGTDRTFYVRFAWRDAAGLTGPSSAVYPVSIDHRPLRLTGIPGGVSNLPVSIQAQGPGTVHYELQEGTGTALTVTADSPVWTAPLLLGVEGIDRTYTLSARSFSPEGRPLSDEARAVVRVDLAVPGTPVFELEPGPAAKATLSASTGTDERLEYRWLWESYPQGRGASDWTPLSASAEFSAPHGEMTKLTVQTRLRDEAGNLGPTAEKTTLLDQNVVYVAPGAGGDGSRAAPLSEIVAAAALAKKSGRGVLFVAAGNYDVGTTLDLGGLRVYGGWVSGKWETSPLSGRAVWTAAAGFRGTSLVSTDGQDWTLTGVDLYALRPLSSVVAVQGGTVSVRDSSWSWSGAVRGWSQTKGSLELTNVSAVYSAQARGSFVWLDSVSAALDNLNLAASGNQEGLLFLSKTSTVTIQDLAVVSKNGSGYDGVWQSDGGSVSVIGARLSAGESAGRALAFRLKEAAASFSRLTLSLSASASNTAFQVTGGSLTLSQSSVSLAKGTEFNQAVVADHAQTSLSDFNLKIDSGSYQGAFNLDGGKLALSSGTITVAGGGQQAWGGRFRGATLVNFDNVTWKLTQATPGQVWMLDAPWDPASAVTGSTVSGWRN